MSLERESMKNLPLGVDDFIDILPGDYIYADKTDLIYKLIKDGSPCFLSRPRRFGKTLLTSTIKCVLEGRREYFKGLKIDSMNYHWEPTPVISLSMSGIDSSSIDSLKESLLALVKDAAALQDIVIEQKLASNALRSLFTALYKKYDQKKYVAILIDEYDAPILNEMENEEHAEKIRNKMHGFYNILKAINNQRGFTFITGVTKFAQASIFSALNNLQDLTLEEQYANICGFTLEEFDTLFSEHLAAVLNKLKSDGTLTPNTTVSDLRETIFKWYDGYSWDGKTKVLNPWSILNFFKKNKFAYYWIESGSTSFLQRLYKMGIIDSGKVTDPGTITSTINVIDLKSKPDAAPFLFQGGYLTVERVKRATQGVDVFYLTVPNIEVENGFVPVLFPVGSAENPITAKVFSDSLLSSLLNLDALGVQRSFSGYLAQYTYVELNANEAYYHSQFRAALFLAGVVTESEELTADGRIDVLYKAKNGTTFVIELKYCPRKTTDNNDGKEESKEDDEALDKKLKEDMKAALENAMKQIDCKQYALWHRVEDAVIQKVTLVVGGRTQVLAAFIQEESK
jgi:hypothetical protein